MQLQSLGWNPSLETPFESHRRAGFVPARVAEEHRERYTVLSELGELDAVVSGRLRFTAASRLELPAVGDWVALQPGVDPASGADLRGSTAVIHAILPRRSVFTRKVAGETTEVQVIAANIDTVFVVTDADRDFSPRRMERYLTLAYESGVQPVIVVNKADLTDRIDELVAETGAIAAGVPVCPVSALTGDGMDAFARWLVPGATIALIGSSGVGKSTLINRFLEAGQLRTSPVRASDGRGRHTTAWRELLLVPSGAVVIDTPGMREIQLWAGEESLEAAFGDIESLAVSCRFSDCRHQDEPGCAILAALGDGSLDAGRFESWLKLRRELRWLERKQDVRARLEEQARWKRIHKAGREHMRMKYGGGGS